MKEFLSQMLMRSLLLNGLIYGRGIDKNHKACRMQERHISLSSLIIKFLRPLKLNFLASGNSLTVCDNLIILVGAYIRSS